MMRVRLRTTLKTTSQEPCYPRATDWALSNRIQVPIVKTSPWTIKGKDSLFFLNTRAQQLVTRPRAILRSTLHCTRVQVWTSINPLSQIHHSSPQRLTIWSESTLTSSLNTNLTATGFRKNDKLHQIEPLVYSSTIFSKLFSFWFCSINNTRGCLVWLCYT
jgi:hypothetical protein